MNGTRMISLAGVALTSLLASGCLETLPARQPVSRPPHYETVTLRLLERQTAYRNDHKVCTRFRLPFRRQEIRSAVLSIDAYNDDRNYSRTLWLEIDGVGGYLAADRIRNGQYQGSGVLPRGQGKRFYIDLRDVPISIQGRASSRVDFERVLTEAGAHTLCTWISTYGQYGPGSWVTVDLELQTTRPLPRHARLESDIWYRGQERHHAPTGPVYRFGRKNPVTPGQPARPELPAPREKTFTRQGLLGKPVPASSPAPARAPESGKKKPARKPAVKPEQDKPQKSDGKMKKDDKKKKHGKPCQDSDKAGQKCRAEKQDEDKPPKNPARPGSD